MPVWGMPNQFTLVLLSESNFSRFIKTIWHHLVADQDCPYVFLGLGVHPSFDQPKHRNLEGMI